MHHGAQRVTVSTLPGDTKRPHAIIKYLLSDSTSFPLLLWRNFLAGVAEYEDIAVHWRVFTSLAGHPTKQPAAPYALDDMYKEEYAMTSMDNGSVVEKGSHALGFVEKVITARLENVR